MSGYDDGGGVADNSQVEGLVYGFRATVPCINGCFWFP